jgi:hypothetical protein
MRIVCNECGFVGEGVNHNERGWRCPSCWSDRVGEAVELKRRETDVAEIVSERYADALRGAGVRTLEEARLMSEGELLEIDGVGPATVRKLKEA